MMYLKPHEAAPSYENGPGIHREPKRPYKCKLYWEPTAAAESAENNDMAE